MIDYAHCIAHGYDMADGVEQQKRAMEGSQRAAERRYALYAHLAGFTPPRR